MTPATHRALRGAGGLCDEPSPTAALAFYGDDFTGSAAVMEVLTFAGLPTVLFLDTPTAEQAGALRRLPRRRHRGRGAGAEPGVDGREPSGGFRGARGARRPIAHYKVCSTLNSAPHVGSIGKAIDLAAAVFGGDWHPLLVAHRRSHRYQPSATCSPRATVCGYRLDRHPTVSRHPTTPMDEADVARASRAADRPADRPGRLLGPDTPARATARPGPRRRRRRSSPSTSSMTRASPRPAG